MSEIYHDQVNTGGRTLTFRVYKAHGETPRLQVRQTPAPGFINDRLNEQIAICEEDVAVFLDGVLKAAAAMGVPLRPARGEKNEVRIARVRKRHPNAYKPWTAEEDNQLRTEAAAGLTPEEIAAKHGRQPRAIQSRIERLFPGEGGTNA